jgi:hypothetical protein
MMETFRQVDETRITQALPSWSSNDNQRKPLSMGRSIFPIALICKPSRSVVTSGKARTKGWCLVSSVAPHLSSRR